MRAMGIIKEKWKK